MSRDVSFVNQQGLRLAGVLDASPSDSILVMAHSFMSDKDEWGFFTRIAKRVHEAGFGVLRFDFAGCGESDDCVLTIQQHLSDLLSAIDFVKQEGYQNIFLYGHSLGGYVCLRAYTQAKKVVVSAPVTQNWSLKFSGNQLREFAQEGFVSKFRDKGVRKHLRIGEKILTESQQINQEFLADINVPVLIIHGQEDRDIPLEDSLSAITYLSADSDLHIINGADHDFAECWDKVSEQIISWIQQ